MGGRRDGAGEGNWGETLIGAEKGGGDVLNCVAHRLRAFVRRHPAFYTPLKLLRDPNARRKLCTGSDDFCLEGYPSSANSFLLNLVLGAAKAPIEACSHCHSIANIRRATGRGLPVLVPVRDPTDAISSRMSRFGVDPERAVEEYKDFYGWLLRHRDRVQPTILTFKAIVENPSEVIRTIAPRLKCSFRDDVDRVADETEIFIRLWSQRYGRRSRVSLPEDQRERSKERMRSWVKAHVAEHGAREVYEAVRNQAST